MHNSMKPKTTKKFDLKTSYVGTCQACFNAQVIKATGGKKVHTMVLHGYERPGFGYIKGNCAGVGHPPYELSCELTKAWKKQCEQHLATRKADLARYEADKQESYSTVVTDYDAPRAYGATSRPTKFVELKRGEKYESRRGGTFTFEDLRRQAIRAAKSHVEELKETVKFLTKRINEWKYAPEALKDHETVKQDAKAVREANKLAAGFRRDWKDTWQRIASVIQDHKRAQDYLDEQRVRSARTDAQYKADHEEGCRRWGMTREFDLAYYKDGDARNLARLTKDLEKFGRSFPSTAERKAARDRVKKGGR